MTCTRPQAESQKNPLTRERRPHMTQLRHWLCTAATVFISVSASIKVLA
jgi:hypothetical protein